MADDMPGCSSGTSPCIRLPDWSCACDDSAAEGRAEEADKLLALVDTDVTGVRGARDDSGKERPVDDCMAEDSSGMLESE